MTRAKEGVILCKHQGSYWLQILRKSPEGELRSVGHFWLTEDELKEIAEVTSNPDKAEVILL